jgi:hypothetical protein
MRPSLLVEVAELGVTVGVLGALQGLGRTLQPVALLLEQPADGVVADRVPLGGERLGQLPGGLAGPAQRGVRGRRGCQAPPAGPMPPAGPDRCRAAAWDLCAGGCAPAGRPAGPARPRHGGPSAAPRGQPCDPADPAIAQCPGRRAEQQPTLPLGQMQCDQGEGRRQHLIQIHWMNLTSPAQPGKATERGPLNVTCWHQAARVSAGRQPHRSAHTASGGPSQWCSAADCSSAA